MTGMLLLDIMLAPFALYLAWHVFAFIMILFEEPKVAAHWHGTSKIAGHLVQHEKGYDGEVLVHGHPHRFTIHATPTLDGTDGQVIDTGGRVRGTVRWTADGGGVLGLTIPPVRTPEIRHDPNPMRFILRSDGDGWTILGDAWRDIGRQYQ